MFGAKAINPGSWPVAAADCEPRPETTMSPFPDSNSVRVPSETPGVALAFPDASARA
ncbi:unannotated protein [freshwater metagenome]|uniref:Unannotated protein n=1 Tax=freshwater metagenome TaxID=449393 RepID=A0A6J6JKW9_9ZZZZ